MLNAAVMRIAGLLTSVSPDNIAEEDVEEIEALRKKMFTSVGSSNFTKGLGQTVKVMPYPL